VGREDEREVATVTPAQKRLADMLALVSTNTKRIARGLPPLATVKRKPRRKKAKAYLPPRAPEVAVEPCFKPTPPRPVRSMVSDSVPEPLDCPPQSSSASSATLKPPRGESSLTASCSTTSTPTGEAPVSPETRFRSECCAIDAETGRKCRRLAHADVVHRHERGTFVRIAAPGAPIPRLEKLDGYALAGRNESDPDDVASGRYATAKKAREKWREKHRAQAAVRAHDGVPTTAGNNETAATAAAAEARRLEVEAKAKWRSTCRASSGNRKCKQLTHTGDVHRDERGEFRVTGQAAGKELDVAAWRSTG
jgi:hypothetical protein